MVGYEPNGPRIGPLPDLLGWSASMPWNDVGAATVEASLATATGDFLGRVLTTGLELACEVWNGHQWVEPRNARYIALKRSTDPADLSRKVSWTVPGYGWQLCKVRSQNTTVLQTEGTNAGKRPFLSATAGMVVGTILDEHATLGGYEFERSFTSTHDSNGQPWSKVLTIYYEHGIALDVILANLAEQGVCDFWWVGRELVVVNPDSVTSDRAEDVALRLDSDIVEAPSEETIEDLVHAVRFAGGEGLDLTVSEPTSPAPWGKWFGFQSNESVTDTGTATAMLQAELARAARLRGQYTRDMRPTTTVAPALDFQVGDWVSAPTVGATDLERVRVMQVQFRADNDGMVTPSLILNDRLLDAELRRARRQRGIVGGSTSEGGSNVRPNPGGVDRRRPAAPQGLVGSSTAYVEGGKAWAQVSLAWAAVTTARPADGGGLLDVAAYNVYRRRTDALFTQPWAQIVTVEGTDADHSPYEPGSTWEFTVRAVSPDGYEGEESSVVSVTMADDTTPPPVPSAPTITYDKGLAFATWDGLTDLGTPMPDDFAFVRLWVGTDTATPADDAAHVARRYGAGRELLPPDPYDVQRYVRLQSVDTSGNATGWSPAVPFTTTLIEGAHVGTVTLTATGQIASVEPDGRVTRMRGGDGLQHLIPVPDDHGGSSLEIASQFGRDFTQYDPVTGTMQGQVVDGQATFGGLTVADDPVLAGRLLFGAYGGVTPGDTSSWLWNQAWGVLPGGYADLKEWVPSSFANGVITGIGQVEVELVGGRIYKIEVADSPVDLNPSSTVTRGSVTGYFFYRYTLGSEPAEPSPLDAIQMSDSQVWAPLHPTQPAYGVNPKAAAYLTPPVNWRAKILYAIRCGYVGGTPGGVYSNSTWQLLVTDQGPQVVSTGKRNNATDQTGSTPPSGGTRRTYTSRWYATERHNWQGSVEYNSYTGGHRAGQGWVNTFNAGPRRSYLRFDSTAHYGETGKTITQALAGATDVTVRYRVGVANSVRSSVPIIVGTASSNGGSITNRTTRSVPRGGTRTTDMPGVGSWLQASSSNRWITHGPGPQEHATYYADVPWGSSEPSSMRAYLEVTYTR